MAVICTFNYGCAPTYPKEKLAESLVKVCKKEYNIEVQTKLIGKMIVVFLPLDELFDSKLDIVPLAIEKIEDVIMTTSRAVFSTDAKLDFYMIIAADIKTTSAELVMIRYLDDVYKLMNGWIKREDYHKRVLWRINFNPKLLQQSVFDFDLREMTLPVFLAEQIAQRTGSVLESSVAYKLKVKGEFDAEKQQISFYVIVADPDRFKKIYVPVILCEAEKVLREYNFSAFNSVVVKNDLLKNTVEADKEELKKYKDVNVAELLTLPYYN